jgi:DNA polymerase III sliding clamp (beta) subunit (PCNA family)
MKVTVPTVLLHSALNRLNKLQPSTRVHDSIVSVEARDGALLLTGRGVQHVTITIPNAVFDEPMVDPILLKVKPALAVAAAKKGKVDRVTLEATPANETFVARLHAAALVAPIEGLESLGVTVDPADELESPITLPGRHVARLLAVICPTISTDEARVNLNQALLEIVGDQLRGCTTDGHRLTLATTTIERFADSPEDAPAAKWSHKVPPALARMILATTPKKGEIPDVVIGTNGIEVGDMRATYQQGPVFPPYKQVIPADARQERTITVKASALLDALKSIGLTTAPVKRTVATLKITATTDAITCERYGVDATGSVVVPAALVGKPLAKLGLQGTYLAQALVLFGESEITLASAGELDPLVVQGNAHGCATTIVIMPYCI